MSESELSPWAIEMRSVTKAFGPVVAVRDASLRVRRGSLHALVGENGAGKSTCMKLLYGLEGIDAGEILINGKKQQSASPRAAIAAGVGMVHQHFMLAGPLSALDNIILGDEPEASSARFLPHFLRPIARNTARARLQALAETYRWPLDLDAPVETMAVGVQQRLEILKLLYRNVDILILDEPTAVLTPLEVDELFTNLSRLKDQGKTIILITHKLREVLRFADEVTVLRRGSVVGSAAVAGQTEDSLAEWMVGRSVQLSVAPPPANAAGVAKATPGLELNNIVLGKSGEKPCLGGLSLSVRPGEIVGIAGIEGNGQSELLQLLLDPHAFFHQHPSRHRLQATGDLHLLGRDVRLWPQHRVRALKVAFIPEDRHREGLLLSENLKQNFLLGLQRHERFRRGAFIRFRALGQALAAAIKDYDVRPPLPGATSGSLSGGNQQKLIIARECERQPQLIICAQPTRGVDVGAIEFIHGRLMAARAAGAAILLVSSSLDEIRSLSDRIIVLFEGRQVGLSRRGELDEAQLGRLMGGAHD